MRFMFFPIIAFCCLPSVATAAECYDVSKGEPQGLTGRVEHRIFAGPPGYEDVTKGDAPEPGFILKLDKAICIEGDGSADPDQKFDEVQIVPEGKLAQRLRTLEGQRISIATRDPMPATTGHHHRPLVVWVLRMNDPMNLAERMMSPLATVQGFYEALADGDGARASGFVIPEKNRRGPLSPRAMTLYFGTLPERLKLGAIRKVGADSMEVRYSYRSKAGTCDGKALVTLNRRSDRYLITSIRTLNGC